MTMTTLHSTVSLRLNGCSRVHQLLEPCFTCPTARSPLGWGAPTAGTNCELERTMSWCPFSKSDHVSKQCRPSCVGDSMMSCPEANRLLQSLWCCVPCPTIRCQEFDVGIACELPAPVFESSDRLNTYLYVIWKITYR